MNRACNDENITVVTHLLEQWLLVDMLTPKQQVLCGYCTSDQHVGHSLVAEGWYQLLLSNQN